MSRPRRAAAAACAALLLVTLWSPLAGAGTLTTFAGGPSVAVDPASAGALLSFPNPARAVQASLDLTHITTVEEVSTAPPAAWGFIFAGCATVALDPAVYRQASLDGASLLLLDGEDGASVNVSAGVERPGLLFEVPVPMAFQNPTPWNATLRIAAVTDGPQPPGGSDFLLALYSPPGYQPWRPLELAPAADNASVLEATVTHPWPAGGAGGPSLVGLLVPTNGSATTLLVDSVNVTMRRLVTPESPRLAFSGSPSTFWQFQSPSGSFGETLGRAHHFQGGAGEVVIGSNGTAIDGSTPPFSVPAGATVTGAFLELVPEPFVGTATSMGGPTQVAAGSGTSGGAVSVSGFPGPARPVVANVVLLDMTATGVVDASQEAALTTQVVGNTSGAERSAAQTFTVQANGTLAAVALNFANATGRPVAPLKVEVRDVNGTDPGNVTLSAAASNASAAQAGGWLAFPLSNPLQVTAGQQLTIVVTAPGAVDGQYWEWRRHDGLPSDPYAAGGSFVAANASGQGAWSGQPAQDFTFRALLDIPLDAPSAGSVSVAGSIGPPVPNPLLGNRTEYVYTVPGIAIAVEPSAGSTGRWNVTVGNALGSAVRFNWSIFLEYALYPRGVSVGFDQEAPSAPLAELDRPRVVDLAAELSAALSSGNATNISTASGTFHELAVRVRGVGPAPLRVRALDVAYSGTTRVTGFEAELNQHLAAANSSAALAEATIQLLAVEGAAVLSNLSIVYSQPPVSFPPDEVLVEEGAQNVTVVDLLQVFADDFDTFGLNYQVISVIANGTGTPGATEVATAAVHRSPLDANLTVTLVDEEFSGIVVLSVLATDTSGLGTVLSGIVVRVAPVDDPPVVPAQLPEFSLAGTTGTLDLSTYILDNDTAQSALTVTASSPFVTVSGLVLTFDYRDAPASLRQETVTLTISDGTTAVTTVLTVLVENAGRPVLNFGPPGALTVTAGRSTTIDLSQFASDDDAVSNLTWELLLVTGDAQAQLAGPSALRVTGLRAGSVSVALSVRDAEQNLVNGTLVLTVRSNQAPRFSAIDGTTVTVTGGGPLTIDLSEFLSDPDDPFTNLTISVGWDNGTVVFAGVAANGTLLTLTRPGQTGGHARVTLTASDPSGASDAATIEVEVEGAAPGQEGLLLLLGAAIAAAALGVFLYRSYRRGQTDRRSLARMKREEGGVDLDEDGRRLVSPAGLEESEEERMVGVIDRMDREAGATRLELPPVTIVSPEGAAATTSLLLLYRDGRPVAWLAGVQPTEREEELEQEVAATVGERLRRRAAGARIEGEEVEMGGRTFAVEARSQLVLVARMEGGPKNPPLRQAMRIALDEIFDRNPGSLKRWDGSARSLRGVDEVLESLFGVPPAPGRDPAPAGPSGDEE